MRKSDGNLLHVLRGVIESMKMLSRSSSDKMLAGIFGGLGEMLDIDPTILRLTAVFIALATAIVPLVATYLIGWLIIPVGQTREGTEA